MIFIKGQQQKLGAEPLLLNVLKKEQFKGEVKNIDGNAQKSLEYKLPCSHLISGNAIDEYFSDIETFLYNPIAFACPFCNFIYSEKEMNKIGSIEFNKNKQKINEEKIQRNLELACQKCNVQKMISEFPQNQPCQNNTICLECLADSYLSGKFYYTDENSSYKPKFDIIKEKGFCLSCKKAFYYVGDYLTSICDSHLHCFECLNKAKKSGRCGVCGDTLKGICVEKINQKLIKMCQICNTNFEAPLIIKKICCPVNICVFCQSKDRQSCFKCLKCEKNLNSYTFEMVLEAQSAIDNYTP